MGIQDEGGCDRRPGRERRPRVSHSEPFFMGLGGGSSSAGNVRSQPPPPGFYGSGRSGGGGGPGIQGRRDLLLEHFLDPQAPCPPPPNPPPYNVQCSMRGETRARNRKKKFAKFASGCLTQILP